MINNLKTCYPYDNAKFIVYINKDDGKHCPFIVMPAEKAQKNSLTVIVENKQIKEDIYYIEHFLELLEKYNIKYVNNKFVRYENR